MSLRTPRSTTASFSRFRTASGVLAAASILLLSSATSVAASPKLDGCDSASFTYSVAAGANPAFMTSVTVTVKELPEGCSQAFSLNAYSTDGPTWPTSGTQALIDHDSITLDDNTRTGTLSVKAPECYGQTDFYKGSSRFDGVDGALPHYPGTVTPSGLIAYSNGGKACEQPSTAPSDAPSTAPSEEPSTAPSEQPSTAPSEEPSTAPSDAPSEEPTTAPSDEPSTAPSEDPSTAPSTAPSDAPSATPQPTGQVLVETGGPTLPPTDTSIATNSGSGPSNPALPLALIGMAAMMAAVVSFTRFAAKRDR